MKPTGRGGPGRGQGRHPEPGYQKLVKLRFLNKQEESEVGRLSPRERVEALVAAARAKNSPTD